MAPFPGRRRDDLDTGRWIATPDIETQFAPDNYMGTHSLLFTIDVYTETGGDGDGDARQSSGRCRRHPRRGGHGPLVSAGRCRRECSGCAGCEDNNDSVYTVLNAVNNAEFQYFDGPRAARRAPQLQHHSDDVAAPFNKSPHEDRSVCMWSVTPRWAARPASARSSSTAAAAWGPRSPACR